MMEQSGLLTEKKTDIKSLTLPELTAEMEAMGEKKFRAAISVDAPEAGRGL